MIQQIRSYLSKIGRKGGKKSRRKLTSQQARSMVAAKKAKRSKEIRREAHFPLDSYSQWEMASAEERHAAIKRELRLCQKKNTDL